ncbi:hypothetical protein MGSAQ_002669, partial [marine sediment metagenome]
FQRLKAYSIGSAISNQNIAEVFFVATRYL